jgi:putative aldouronate transport system substrate-binding protein
MYREKWFINSSVQALKSEGKDNRTYVPVPILYDPATQVDNNLDPIRVTGNNGVIISKNCKDPKRAMDYMNFLLEEPVAELLSWGEEGVDYSKDDKGLFTRNDEQYKNWNNNDWLRDNTGYLIRNYTPKRAGTYSDGNCCTWTEQESIWYSKLSQYDKDFLKAYKKDNFLQFLRTDNIVRAAYYPTWGNIILEKDSPEALVQAKLESINNQWVPQVIAAPEGKFEELFQQYWDDMMKVNPKILTDALRREMDALEVKFNG